MRYRKDSFLAVVMITLLSLYFYDYGITKFFEKQNQILLLGKGMWVKSELSRLKMNQSISIHSTNELTNYNYIYSYL
jgi:hypothetical protein